MQTAALAAPAGTRVSWTGRTLSALVVVFLIFDGTIHLLKPTPVVEAFAQLGYPLHLSLGIGLIELAALALYVIPRTAPVGALLLTAYLGGATATQVRIEAAWFPTMFPVLVGALLWAGLALRDPRARELFVREHD